MNNKKKMFWIRPVVRPTYQKCNQQTSKRKQNKTKTLKNFSGQETSFFD